MKITNNSKALQGVQTTKGTVFIVPGGSRDDITLTEKGLALAKRLTFISIEGEEAERVEETKVEIPTEGYAVVSPKSGWYVIAHDGEIVTKNMRKADVEGFDDMSDEDKAAFVDLNKPAE